jgi:predicted aminopeptidase
MKLNIFFLSVFPALVSVVLLSLGILLFFGCYTVKQGTTMLGYLGKAIPLEDLALRAGEASDADTLAFINRITDIRRFAMEELGLKESKNYTRYVELDRDYLAAIVSACAADSFTRHEWTFPVVGTVPYKGFFNPGDAKKEAAKLSAEGLDVWIRGVDAFSTLGWFRDPLYSYMKDYSDYRLADLIIHELLHATVFVRGQVQFNEQLAEFVGTRGARLYVESRFGDAADMKAIDGNTADAAAYRAFLGELSAELEAVYADESLNRSEKLAQKERIIKAAQERFAAEYDMRFQSQGYRSFSALPVNNAYLDLYRLYYGEESAEKNFFSGLYEQLAASRVSVSSSETGNLRIFISAAASLNGSRAAAKDPRQALAAALERL